MRAVPAVSREGEPLGFPPRSCRSAVPRSANRMHAGVCDLFEAGFDAVAIIGSDLPTVSPAHVRAAFDVLARRPEVLVLGPADLLHPPQSPFGEYGGTFSATRTR